VEEKNKRQQLLIKLVCVVAALSLWLYIYNIENPIKEVNFTVPVEIANLSSLSDINLAMVSDKPLTVTLNISGSITDISNLKASDFTLVADMSGYVVRRGDNKIPVEIKKSPGSIKIVNGDNLWVKVTIDDLNQKSLSIQFTPNGKAKDGYLAMHPVTSITKAVVTGPKIYTDLVQSISAKYSIDNLSADFKTNIKLEALDANGNTVSGVNINPSNIDAAIPVKKVKSVDVIINTTGSIPSIGVKSVSPVNPTIDIAGDSSVIDSITSIETENIDLSKLNGKDTIDVKLILPKGVAVTDNSTTVKVKITYENIIQKTLTLPVQFNGLDSAYNAVSSPSQVNVIVSGSESDINGILPSTITCYVDVTGNIDGSYNKTVNVKLPDRISKVSIDAATVNVTVTKKKG
jgi:YbbR domain-containing protein